MFLLCVIRTHNYMADVPMTIETHRVDALLLLCFYHFSFTEIHYQRSLSLDLLHNANGIKRQ